MEQLASHEHSYSKGTTGRLYTGGGSGPLDKNVVDVTGSTGGSQPHTHSLTGAKSGSASSLPPYYAGQYVIRV